MTPPHRDRVARGATLYSRKFSSEKTKERIRVDPGEVKIMTREVQDTFNADNLIRKLELAGLEVKAYKKKYILRRIRARMSRLGHTTYSEYMGYLDMSPLEANELKESLSINVTRFFRNRDTYEVIRDEILPQIIKQARMEDRSEIRIWSAGCAVGAEPYSLAMIASDVVPGSMRVRIIASDIKEELLSTAKFGVYSDQYVAEMHPFEIQNYFNVNLNAEYSVKPEIKRMVSFQKLDLMKDRFPSNLDLILCRNVLIYIDRKAQNDIISKFFSSLRTNGMLILGRTETLFIDWRKYINILSTKHRIYQKIHESQGELPKMEFGKPKRTRIAELSTTHKKRLRDLKNFREEYEQRKTKWEKRIERTERKTKPKTVIPTTRSNPKQVIKLINTHPIRDVNTKYRGQLSSYRESLKRKSSTDLLNPSFEGLFNKKTPEEVYRELKRMREKRIR